jgi:hypothetical protein
MTIRSDCATMQYLLYRLGITVHILLCTVLRSGRERRAEAIMGQTQWCRLKYPFGVEHRQGGKAIREKK